MSSSKALLSIRHSTQMKDGENQAAAIEAQLAHFGISADSDYGRLLGELLHGLFHVNLKATEIQSLTLETLSKLDRTQKQSYFNAKKFIAFQLAKVIHNFHPSFKTLTYELAADSGSTQSSYVSDIMGNVPALFSASPVITKTATYTFASTEWIADAFSGKESTHHVYSRLMNPTSISLALKIVELEAGPYRQDYMAWNFNSGMAAIDALFSNVLSYGDILIVSRNIYGGVYQLLHDYYAKKSKLNCQLAWFDGSSKEDYETFLKTVQEKYQSQIGQGAKVHTYIESPCNPHGVLLDVPGICKVAHQHGLLVMLDSTLATPILSQPLQHQDKQYRPDYVLHSYTKDIAGHGNVIGGVVIGENHRMFIPKGESSQGVDWSQTLFWDVYYIKGGFLSSESCYEVLTGLKTLELRMKQKAINTMVLTSFLSSNKHLSVFSPYVDDGQQKQLLEQMFVCGMPSPLFSVNFESLNLPTSVFTSFLDSLEPAFSQMVSIGQINTMALCPAQTTHSELSREALADAGITPTTLRISVGCESVLSLCEHLRAVSTQFIDPHYHGFSENFMTKMDVLNLVEETTVNAHRAYLKETLKN
ncbi:trans-sulfuration enzyme family protein [Algicola sagamiensis]|uniref:trans-sulfuration enzyme family protein n=1 Tax=Algicola sagamiensis TaxID=163869 RepID=UPI000366A7A3|nr:aminotransferase class I/II-fold pyridoxal phosphate-dependent enzyme [Algicola sagamiensis]